VLLGDNEDCIDDLELANDLKLILSAQISARISLDI
jgi:hypothetical protein